MKKSCVLILALTGCCGDVHEPRAANIIERYEWGKGHNIVEVQGVRLATNRVLGEVGEKIWVLPGQIRGGLAHCGTCRSEAWSFRKRETETLNDDYIARAVRLLKEVEK